MWSLSLVASLQFSDFCSPLAAVLLCFHNSWLFSPSVLFSHLDPAGGRSGRQLQEKTSELYKRFWLKFGKKYPFLLFISSQQMSFFSHSANFSLDVPSFLNLILFPFLGLPVLSLLPFSWSQSFSHMGPSFFFSFSQSFIHSFCPLIHYLFSHSFGCHD